MSSPLTHVEAGPVVAERSYLRQVFSWMILALAITTGVAVWFSNSSNVVDYFDSHGAIFFVVLGVQLAMVFALVGAINRISAQVATIVFCLYAGLTGLTFSILLETYTTGSVVAAFAGATGVFAGMAFYGYATERDLSGWGAVLFGGLIGLIAASVVFIFVGGGAFNFVLGCVGVVIFAGLTAYDMQKLKAIGARGLSEDDEHKAAIIGALSLYLDFINLFLSLLRIFGSRN
jgi:uncharacterized protein